MLLAGGAVDGVRVLSEESVRAMRTDRLTAEQKSQNFLGAPFWIGRGFGLNLSLVTDEAKATPFFGPGGPGGPGAPGGLRGPRGRGGPGSAEGFPPPRPPDGFDGAMRPPGPAPDGWPPPGRDGA